MVRSATFVALALGATLAGACAFDSVAEGEVSLTACPASGSIQDPPQFVWTYHPASASNPTPYYSGTLEYGVATFTLNDGSTLTTRAYRQAGGAYAMPGPTIKMSPGNKYVLRFHNTLPYEAATGEHNVFKDPNVTNLHTHGLHISGETPSDDVTRYVEGGYGADYVYDIPADHMGGTYWYHAHHHGSTMLQVSSGAFGLMLIDDGNDGIPANVAAMTERQVVVAYLDPGVAGTGGDTLISGTATAGWTVNGQKNGQICTTAGEWQHWRVLLADRDASEKTLGFGAGCEVQLLARDGVWRTTAPRALATGSINLTGASRADFAIRCANDSTITINNNPIATILASGTPDTTVGPFSGGATGGTWSAVRPSYLRDLRGETNVHSENIRMGARTVNGSKFDADVPNLTLPATQVQNWSLSGNNQHPFHLHVYHVQAVDCSGTFEPGEYYDVVSQACSVRFDLNAATSKVFEGRTILHCHILEHEDQGAMGWLDVVGGVAPPTFPADTGASPPYAVLYPLEGAPPTGCGDGTCDVGETSCSCPTDCGAPPSSEGSCGDGVDADCDGQTDCADADCAAAPECTVACDGDGVCEAGEDCTTCASDCAGVTGGKPQNRYCCGDGTAQAAEGDGAICDGNY